MGSLNCFFVKWGQVVRVEYNIRGEVVFHPAGFFFQKVKPCCGRSIFVDMKSEVVLVHDDLTFRFLFKLIFFFLLLSRDYICYFFSKLKSGLRTATSFSIMTTPTYSIMLALSVSLKLVMVKESG